MARPKAGNGSHWTTTGATAIYLPTRLPSRRGFRVYVRYSSGGSLTPAFANSKQWHLNWSARSEVITKYYAPRGLPNGQRIAMSKGGTLYYLHGDRLPSRRGSTTLETATNGQISRNQQDYGYGKRRSGSTGALHSDNTYTGQKLDSSGLMYYFDMNFLSSSITMRKFMSNSPLL